MNKRAQIDFLNRTVALLEKMNLKERHLVLIALLGWHVRTAPEDMKQRTLTHMSEQAFKLLKQAEKRVLDEASDLRH